MMTMFSPKFSHILIIILMLNVKVSMGRIVVTALVVVA